VDDREKGRRRRVAEPAVRMGKDGRRVREELRRKERRRVGLAAMIAG